MPLLSRSCIAAVLVFVVAGLGMTPSTSEAQTNFRTRSAVLARNGMVATSQPLAAQAGLDVLRRGGNAVDAAIAANAMLGVVEPMSCGIGGDLFVIYWDAKTQEALRPQRQRPQPVRSYARRCSAERGLKEIPDATARCPGRCPAASSGWDELRTKFGTKPLAELLAPAIEYAEEGFPVSRDHRRRLAAARARPVATGPTRPRRILHRRPAAARRRDLPQSRPGRARYRLIAEEGADAFYTRRDRRADRRLQRGATAAALSLKDFADHKSDWIEPVSTNYRGYDVWELPPNGQGIAALQMLNLLEPYDLRSSGLGSADYLHLLIEAKKLAFADRARLLRRSGLRPAAGRRADLEGVRRRAAQADRPRARPPTDVPHGDPKLRRTATRSISPSSTRTATAARSFRATTSASARRSCRATSASRCRTAAACSRSTTSISTASSRTSGRSTRSSRRWSPRTASPWFCFGVMGGDMQPQGHVQVLVNMIDFGMNVQAAGDAARVRHDGSATPTGQPADADGGTVFVESGISDAVFDELERRGHTVERAARAASAATRAS